MIRLNKLTKKRAEFPKTLSRLSVISECSTHWGGLCFISLVCYSSNRLQARRPISPNLRNALYNQLFLFLFVLLFFYKYTK